MSRVHVFSEYVWPDDSPTGIYAEQLADSMIELGYESVLVGGTGTYRRGARPAPKAPVARVDHWVGRRGPLVEVLRAYVSVTKAFADYIDREVGPGDVVVMTSAPPLTLLLSSAVRRRRATAVHWLQDYYPELVRGLLEYPKPMRFMAEAVWNRLLLTWDFVVKSAGNLGYEGANSRVIRNWPTLDLGAPLQAIPKTALYSGNLGYAHDLRSFIQACETLHADGYRVTVRGDGPGIARLPAWIVRESPVEDVNVLIRSYWEAEVHLVAGHPRIHRAVFPSKVWNSIASGRRIIATGFAPVMQRELEVSVNADHRAHRRDFANFVASLL